jgi:hypothetical protein
VLAPLASIVLDGNHLGGVGLSAQVQIKLLYYWLGLLRFQKGFLLLLGLTVVGVRSYVFSSVQREIQSPRSSAKKCLFGWLFLVNNVYFVFR